MPYAFKPFGLVLGFVMIVFCGACSATGLLLQGHASKYAGTNNASFFALSQITYPQLSVVFDLAIAVKCFGVGVSYMVVVGDLLPQICLTFTTNHLLLERNFHITLVMLFVVAPLCFMRRLDSLRYASMIAISAVAYLCVLVVVHFLWPSQEILELRGDVHLWKPHDSHSSALSSFPIFVFAYTCHHNMFSIVNELKDNSLRNIYRVAITAMALAMLLYVMIGGSGYATFGDNVAGNIITLYPQATSTTIGRVAIVILVMLAFPLQCHPARASINHIFHYFTFTPDSVETPSVSSAPTNKSTPRGSSENSHLLTIPTDELVEEGSPQQPSVVPLEHRAFILITSGILLCSYLLAISVTSLARVLAIVGATGSTSISFILPGVFGYQLIGSEYKNEPMPVKTKIIKYAALLLTCWGFCVLVTCLSATLFYGAGH